MQYLPESIEPISEEHKKVGVISWEEFMELGKVMIGVTSCEVCLQEDIVVLSLPAVLYCH